METDSIPSSWSSVLLGDIVANIRPKVSPNTMGGTRFIGMEHIEPHTRKLLGSVPTESMKSAAVAFHSEDILFGRLRPYLNKVFRPNFDGCCSAEFIPLTAENGISAPFIERIVSSSDFVQFTGTLDEGDRPRVNYDGISEYALGLPPEPEQRRIVAKLDALQSRTRLAREALAAIPTLLDHYRQSVLAAAFDGSLTAAWRKSKATRTSVDVAFRSIKTPPRPSRYGSRSDTVIEGDHALSVGDPKTELPSGWRWLPLVDIARLESGHTPSRQHSEWWGGKIPWICIPDARDNHGGTIMQTTENTNDLGIENSAARLLPIGTVCLSRTASVGYVTVMGKPMATSQDFVNWICTPIIDSHWLKFLLMAENQALFRFGKGSTHTTIYFPEVVSFHVGLPPIEEQRLIVEIVERQMRRLDELSIVVSAGLTNCSSLDQSLLATAFRGELVPQDPNDEPASVLLDRIRAARAQADTTPRSRRPRAASLPTATTKREPKHPADAFSAKKSSGNDSKTLLTALRKRGSLSNAEAQALTGHDPAQVRTWLKDLVTQGHARTEGQKRGMRYVAV